MAMPQGSGFSYQAPRGGVTQSITGTITTPVLPGYVQDVLRIILELGATGEPVAFPDPIGQIARFNMIYGGNLLIERASDQALFIVTKYGDIAGPLVGLGGFAAPSFESVSGSTTLTQSTSRLYIGPTGLPTGTLPSAMSYQSRGAPIPGIVEGSGAVFDPDLPLDLLPPEAPPIAEPKEPISLLTIAGIGAALWFAIQ